MAADYGQKKRPDFDPLGSKFLGAVRLFSVRFLGAKLRQKFPDFWQIFHLPEVAVPFHLVGQFGQLLLQLRRQRGGSFRRDREAVVEVGDRSRLGLLQQRPAQTEDRPLPFFLLQPLGFGIG